MTAHALTLPSAGDATPGRSCPIDYLYSPVVFDRTAEIQTDVLYVVGGLYGNLEALEAVRRLAAVEPMSPTLVFNGDFHWFDAEPGWFFKIERAVTPHLALRGNVETETARATEIGAGCGCAYPPSVDDDTVRRSNEILRRLHGIAPDQALARLARLPMHLVAQIGRLRVGIVHGDACSLAGWRFAHDSLDDPLVRPWLDQVRRASHVDLFASTHTCLAALRDFALPGGRLTIINNGAAGMPNFKGTTFGVITRVATTPSPHRPLYGLQRDGVHIEALAVDYDQRAFLDCFLARWPQGSPAHASYFRRIAAGPDYAIASAMG
jgi:hypothetical protein